MKNFFNNILVQAIGFGIIGFICGFVIDSSIFHISPICCGLIEGLLLGGISYALSLKDRRK